MGGIVLRSQREPAHSGYLEAMVSDTPLNFPDVFELSSGFQYANGQYGCFGTMGYGVNAFQRFVFDILAQVKDTKTNKISSFYGLDFEHPQGSRLFE